MGNQLILGCCHHQNDSSVRLSKYSSVDQNESSVDISHNHEANTARSNFDDTFFTKYVQSKEQKVNPNGVQTHMDQRRIVFVSLTGFYATWKNVPSVMLYTALCLLPLKRKWIMQPSKYHNQLQKRLIAPVTKKSNSDTNVHDVLQFIELLQWKESQGLVLWIYDYFDRNGNLIPNDKGSAVANPNVTAFWYAFNDKVTSLYDHITERHYKSLHLEEEWWTNKDTFVSKYGTKPTVILNELYALTKSHSYRAIKEIIYQSNPQSLHPITVYNDGTAPVIVRAKDRLKAQYANGIAISPLSPIKERLTAEVSPSDKKYDHVYVECVNKILNDTDDHKDEE